MSPIWPSRHFFTEGIYRDIRGDGNEVQLLTDRKPYRFRPFRDNIMHRVVGGDTLFTIAGQHYRDIFRRPAGLWWVIADFQPTPIFDPTIELTTGTYLFVPSPRVVDEIILSDARRDEPDP